MKLLKSFVRFLAVLGISLGIVFCVASPALAAYMGTYEGTLFLYSTKLKTGEHDQTYGKATASIKPGHAGGGIYWIEAVGGGRCSSMASIPVGVTREMTYTSSFTGSVQLWGTAMDSNAAPYYVTGNYCFNVR